MNGAESAPGVERCPACTNSPKKVTSQCDNWWGISLLDVMGKVFTKVILMRLQKVAEEVLPDSQCGFRVAGGKEDGVSCCGYGVLLYGAEAWVNKRAVTKKLESFNNKCLRHILGITKAQQRTG